MTKQQERARARRRHEKMLEGTKPPKTDSAKDLQMFAVILAALLIIAAVIVVPKLMGAAIAVHPLLVIFGILAGAQIMGVGGVLLALPLLAICREVLLFVRERTYLARWPRREDALP